MESVSNTQVQLIPGGGGIFEVKVDGEIVYEKKSSGKFPEDGELTTILKEKGFTIQ